MAKFKKKIVTPGVHNVGRLDGTEEKDAITPERIKKWRDNTKKLQELGVLIPAPLAHQDKNKRFAFPVIKAKDDETLADAYSGINDAIPPAWDIANLNAGFWEDFEVGEDGSLVGTVEAPGDENDLSTPAGKLGKTVKQTSVLVMPGRTVVDKDGNSHSIGEHLAHVACCLHSQEPGQANFEPLTSVPPGMAMSFVLAMDEITGLPDPNKPKDEELYNVIMLMRSALNVALPEDTTRENFLNSLKLVLTQKLADQREKEQQESLNQRPEDAQTRSPNIAMSQTVQKQDPPAPTGNKTEALLMNMLVNDKRKNLKDRIQKLIANGQCSKDYADKKLLPRVEALTMSAADLTDSGEFPKTLLEELVEGLEEATPLTGPSVLDQGFGAGDFPVDGAVEQPPQDVIVGHGVNDLSDDQLNTLMDEVGFGQ